MKINMNHALTIIKTWISPPLIELNSSHRDLYKIKVLHELTIVVMAWKPFLSMFALKQSNKELFSNTEPSDSLNIVSAPLAQNAYLFYLVTCKWICSLSEFMDKLGRKGNNILTSLFRTNDRTPLPSPHSLPNSLREIDKQICQTCAVN